MRKEVELTTMAAIAKLAALQEAPWGKNQAGCQATKAFRSGECATFHPPLRLLWTSTKAGARVKITFNSAFVTRTGSVRLQHCCLSLQLDPGSVQLSLQLGLHTFSCTFSSLPA